MGVGLQQQLHAAEPASAKLEIEYLLQHIEQSGCEFYRNGTWYDARKGRAHLLTKYDYLSFRGLIVTTEDFITKAATESSFSGQIYQVRCDGHGPTPSGQWLLEALTQYRSLKSAR